MSFRCFDGLRLSGVSYASEAKHFERTTTPGHAPRAPHRDVVSRPARITPRTRRRTRTHDGRRRLGSRSLPTAP
eukprot:3587969-Prymnesium_polylepis.1